MESGVNVDWARLMMPDTPLLEIIFRGSAIYLGLFLLLRLVLKRQSGGVGITDLLVVVLIADAAQNGMADDYHSVTDGLLLVGVIIFWSHLLDWLGYRFPALARLIHPPPLPLIRNGVMMRRNLRQELITEEELLTQLRQQGIQDVKQVKMANMEGDGRVSVVPFDKAPSKAPERPVP